MTFWRTTLLIEATFHLHNYSIDEREYTCVTNETSDIDPDRYNKPSYWEHLYLLREAVIIGSTRRQGAVHEAILKQIISDGRKCPSYNVTHNVIEITEKNG
jgi:hypothetical protein